MTHVSKDTEAIGQRIVSLHNELHDLWPELIRIAIAIYDPEHDELNTFINSDHGASKLDAYSAKLTDVPSLKNLVDNKQHRVVNDISEFSGSTSAHSKWLIQAGFKSSYTVPLFGHDRFLGFLFFDSDKINYFSKKKLLSLNVYSKLLEAILQNEMTAISTLRGAINTTQYLTHQRDAETATHIIRMSRYAHLIARNLSKTLGLKDDYIEFILQYAPMHDIGKIGIVDDLLLKPGRLTAIEFEAIKLHVENGIKIIDTIVREFDLSHFKHLKILYNIIGSHHEKVDGTGYPKGLRGDEIPLEARIIAVADVLDALSNPRAYKKAWSFDNSIKYLVDNSGSHFDPVCVSAVTSNRKEFEAIFHTYKDED